MDQNAPAPTITQSVSPEERVGKTKTVYDISGGEIFWRNFLAGFSRALGNIFVYILFLFFSFYIFTQTILPYLKPYIDQYTEALETITTLNQMSQPADGSRETAPSLDDFMANPEFQNLIREFQKQPK